DWRLGHQPVSQQYDDVYFSLVDALAETEYVFLQHNQLSERWQHSHRFVIAETGFGCGLNFLTTVHHWLTSAPANARLFYISVEKYPLSQADLQQTLSAWPQLTAYSEELIRFYPPAMAGFHPVELFDKRVSLLLLLGDVEIMLQQVHAEVDAWYLDGFAPAKNPDMWTDKVFAEIARLSKPGASFSSFTAAGLVKRGLAAQGFEVFKDRGFGSKREMLYGYLRDKPVFADHFPWYAMPAVSYTAKCAAVIGGGIAGLTTASALVKRGWEVDVFERHASLAREGSGNPAGVLLPRLSLDDSAEGEFYAMAYQYALTCLERFRQQHEMLDWHASGVIQLAITERIRHQLQQGRFDTRFVQTVTAQQASDICGITLQHDALYYPAAGWLRPSQLCRQLAESSPHIHVYCDIEVKQLDYLDQQWRIGSESNAILGHYDCVILANAISAKQFIQTDWLPLRPVRGQISYITSSDQLQRLRCPVCYEGYILPELDQQHIAGASFGPDDDSDDVRVAEHQQNLASLQHAIPELGGINSSAIMAGRAAVRAVAADRMPLLGPVAERGFFDHHYADLAKGRSASRYAVANYLPGLYVNTGHGARGLTSSFLAAELLAALMNNEPLPVSNRVLHALLPARFLIRAYKKGRVLS
ncbi:MAG: bifunctional tRNA (5-methylaminomethyl-2-thiouridine)(34)-methyltransferase MnmD/FAD-dependent 5-carboxymethylaminomethyl-2-thiouridine(34) oxidoreductase MnmC, partial [Gammaproteobacteria bacterium]